MSGEGEAPASPPPMRIRTAVEWLADLRPEARGPQIEALDMAIRVLATLADHVEPWPAPPPIPGPPE